MKYKFSLNRKNIFRLVYLAFILANIVVMFYLGGFLKKYVFYSYFPADDFSSNQIRNQANDINMVKFNDIVKNLEKKSSDTDFSQTRDIFD